MVKGWSGRASGTTAANEDYTLAEYRAHLGSRWGEVFAGRAEAAGRVPTMADELAYITGVKANGQLTRDSWYGSQKGTAHKWGDPHLGVGTTISYAFDPTSGFSDTEKNTFLRAFAMWSAVANVTFVSAATQNSANVLLHRGFDGKAETTATYYLGSGSTPGSFFGQAMISIDTSRPGFDLSGSLFRGGGYGWGAAVHEVGHLLGLGHAGAYNFTLDSATQQYSPYDNRLYSIMSYIDTFDQNAKYANSNPAVYGADWGSYTDDGSRREMPNTPMGLDIAAIQQLYGAAQRGPFTTAQTFGYHSTIFGQLAQLYDFSYNIQPVVTLYDQAPGNTLDLSETFWNSRVDLHPGAFSDVLGLKNNLYIAPGTDIHTVICGGASDTVYGNDKGCVIKGGGNWDYLYGGAGNDWIQGDGGDDALIGQNGTDTLAGGTGQDAFIFNEAVECGKTAAVADIILDFSHQEGDVIAFGFDANVKTKTTPSDPFTNFEKFTFIGTAAFSHHPGELRYDVVPGELLVSGDTNGDAKPDFFLHLIGVQSLVATDFG